MAFHAVPASGSRFAGWSGACSGSVSPCTVLVAPGQTVTAVFDPNPVLITSPLQAKARVGQPFVYQLTASGDPTSIGASGLPAWLTFDAYDSTLRGVPPAAGTVSVTLSASRGSQSDSKVLTLTSGVAPSINSALTWTLSGATTAWTNVLVSATGTSPILYTVSSLPGAVGFNSTTGRFSGNAGATGVFNVPVVAANEFGADYKVIAVSVGGSPVITSALSAGATVGSPFSYTLTATGTGTITRAVSSLPGWTAFNASSGVLSGSPTAAGTYSIGLHATNSVGSSTQTLLLTVDGPAQITSGLTASGLVGQVFGYSLTAEGTLPIGRAVTGLPAWASFDAGTGLISGTPTTAGTFTVGLEASNAFGADARQLTITIAVPPPPPAPPVITSALQQTLHAGTPWSYAIEASGTVPMTFSALQLPSWVTFNAPAGTLTGTPPEGVFELELRAVNALGSDTRTVSLTVQVEPQITSALAVDAVVGQPFSYQITTSGTSPVVGALGWPGWATYDAVTGMISGVPSGDGQWETTLTATNLVGEDVQTLTVTARTVPVINSTLAVSAVVGQPFSYAVTSSGTAPSFSVGALPSWLTFNAATGILSGTPSQDAMEQVVFTATNPAGSDTKTLVITVRTGPVINSALAVSAVVGQPFSYAVTSSGTAPSFSVGALPSWLTFNAATGALSGTPSQDGTEQVVLTATNPAGSDTQTLVITVRTIPTITSALAVSVVVGQPFSYAVTSSGTTPSLTVGALPNWLAFDASTGILSGTPSQDATEQVVFTATNPAGSDSKTLVITVRTVPAITSALAVSAVVGQPFSYAVTSSGTESSFSVGALPSWLTFDAASGVLSGTSSQDATEQIAFTATNPAGSDAKTLVITVRTVPAITSAMAVSAVVGQPFSYALTASGTNPSFSSAALPSWLTFNAATGVLSGTPSQDATEQIAFTATNPAGSDTKTLVITVRTVPVINSALAVSAVVGQPFSYVVTASGTSPSFSVGALPNWLSFDAATGILAGTPSQDATEQVVFTATNPAGSDTKTLVITVRTVPAITSALAVSAVVGQPFSYVVTASGTEPAFSVQSVPEWLSFDDATGLLSGTPSQDATEQVVFTAINPAGSDTETLVITVRTVPAITSALAVPAVVGQPFSYALTASGTEPAFSVQSVPEWLSFDAATGLLSGTPSQDATEQVVFTATNPAGSDTKTLVITVRTLPQVTSPLVVHAAVGSAFHYSATANGTPEITFSYGSLPAEFSSLGAVLQGVPATVGSLPLTLTATNGAGSVSETLTVHVRASLTAPGVTGPLDGGLVNTATPEISGQAEASEAGGVVTVREGHTILCTAAIAADGTWACSTSTLPEGPHALTATLTDPNGLESALIDTVTFTVDLTAPEAPIWAAPSPNAILATATPTLSGTGEPESTLRVFDGGSLVCTAVVGLDGIWSCLPQLPLAEGAHTLTARLVDPANNPSPGADLFFTVDLTAPLAPALSSPLAGAHIPTQTPVLTGTAEPFATVQVTVDGALICAIAADAQGHFECPVTEPLSEGPHQVTLTATDAAGNVSQASTSTFHVDSFAPPTPELATPAAGGELSNPTPTYSGTARPGTTVNVLVDGIIACSTVADASGNWSCTQPFPLADGPHVVTVSATSPSGLPSAAGTATFTVDTRPPAVPVTSPVGDGDLTADDTPRFSGTAEPFATVIVSVDGVEVCRATANAAGQWFCDAQTPLADGSHTLSIVVVDAAGNASEPSTSSFRVDTTAPVPPEVSGPRSDGGLITDPTPTFQGTAEPGSQVTVFVDGEVVCTAVADATGAWSCAPQAPLEPGLHDWVVHVTDPAGNTSEAQSGTFDLRTETVAPNPPDVKRPPTASSDNGTIDGTATPGSTVVVYVDGEEVGRTQADENGHWSFTLPLLSEGTYEITIGVLDDTGREVHRSEPMAFEVRNPDVMLGGGISCSSTGGSADLGLLGLLLTVALALWARRPKAGRAAGAAAAVAVIVATGSVGTAAQAQSRVEGFELEQLSWNPGARDGLLLGGGDVLGTGGHRLSASLGYQNSPLRYIEDGHSRATLVRHRLTALLSGAYGVNDWLEIGAWVPVIAHQSGDAVTSARGDLVVAPIGTGAALGTPWLQARAALLRESDGAPIDLGIGLGAGLPLGSGARLTRDPTVALLPKLGLGKDFGGVRLAAEAGALIRPTSTALLAALDRGEVDRMGSRFEAGVGAAIPMGRLTSELSARLQVPLSGLAPNVEVMGGVRVPVGRMELFALAGPGFGNSPGVPVVRGIVGAAFGGARPNAPAPVISADEPSPPLDAAARPEVMASVAVAEVEVKPEEVSPPAPGAVAPEPEEAGPAPQAGDLFELNGQIHFDTGRAVIQTRSHALLRGLAQTLMAHPEVGSIDVEGHTDSQGAAGANRRLSQARAEAVVAFLVAEGVDPARLRAKGYGPDQPVASNATAGGREKNRRVEIRVAD